MEIDYIDIGTVTPMKVFNQKLAETVLKYNKLFKPFDEPCARLDFADKIAQLTRECERTNGYVKDMKLNTGDFEKYGDIDRFELIEDQEAYVDKVIEGSRTQVILGHTISYKCKERGHGISVFVPNDAYEAMQNQSKTVKKVVKEE